MKLSNTLRFLFCGSFLVFVTNSFADGTYQHAHGTRTLVWNNYPEPGDAVDWSGDRDEKRYATGEGTLIWYKLERRTLTGSNVPFGRKRTEIASYSGKMVKGKLEGRVTTVNAEGKKLVAKFADGKRVGDWTPAPSRIAEKRRPETVAQASAEVKASESSTASTEASRPAPPAEGPSTLASRPAGWTDVSKPTAQATPPAAMDDSLKSLISPPSLLRMQATADGSLQSSAPATDSSAAARPNLTAAEVVGLADIEARAKGHNVDQYQRSPTDYNAVESKWSLTYEPKPGESGAHFGVSVDDKTKKASLSEKP